MLHSNCYRAAKVNLPTSLGFPKESWLPFKISQKMYKTHFIGGSEIAKTSYKAYANKLTKVKCLAKKLYFHSELETVKVMVAKSGIYSTLFCPIKKQTMS